MPLTERRMGGKYNSFNNFFQYLYIYIYFFLQIRLINEVVDRTIECLLPNDILLFIRLYLYICVNITQRV